VLSVLLECNWIRGVRYAEIAAWSLVKGRDKFSNWRDEESVLEMVLDYGGSISRILHIFNLSLCTILIHLSLITNFTLLFPSVSKI